MEVIPADEIGELGLNRNAMLEELRRQQQQLKSLNEIARAVATNLDVEAIFPAITAALEHLISFDRASVALVDEGGETWTISTLRTTAPESEVGRGTQTPIPPDIRAAISNRRGIFHSDLALSDAAVHQALVREGLRSGMVAPLISRGRVIGTLNVAACKPGAYTGEHLALLQAVADQIAPAVENARLYATMRASEERYRTLVETAWDVIFTVAADGTITSLSPTFETITGWPRADWLGQPFAALIHPEDLSSAMEAFQHYLRGESTLLREVRVLHRSGELLVLEFSIAPQLQDGKIVGVLGVGRDVTRRRQAEEELRRYAERLKIQHEIDRAILTAQTPAEIAGAALSHLRRLVPCQRASVALFDFQARELAVLAVDATGESRLGPGVRVPVQQVSGLVEDLRQGKIRVVEDLRLHQMTATAHVLQEEGTRASINVPLIVQGELIGSLNLGANTPRAFTTEQIEITREVANSLVVAIHNARLYEAAQRRAEETRLTSEILQSLNAAPDITEAFPAIVAGLRAITNCERASLVLFDAGGDEFRIIALDQPRDELGSGVTRHLSETAAAPDVLAGRIHLTPDLAAERDFPAEQALYQAGHRSRINLPLRVGEHVIGALNLTWIQPAGYNLAQLPLLEQIAAAVALAVERSHLWANLNELNATLEERIRRRTFDLQVLLEYAQQIGYTLDHEELVRLMIEQLHRAVTYDVAACLLATGDVRELFIRPMRPLAPGLQQALAARLATMLARMSGQVVDGEHLTIRLLHTADSDATAEPLTHLRSTFQVPLTVGEDKETVGFLFVGTGREEAFSEDQVRLLYTVAYQASASLQRLRALLAAEEQRLGTLVDHLPVGVLLLNANRRLVLANPAAGEALPVLAEVEVGEILTHLGGQSLNRLLRPQPSGRPHEIVLEGPPRRVFEVASRPVEAGPEAGGWVLVLRDVTWERDLLAAERSRRQELDALHNLSRRLAAIDAPQTVLETVAHEAVTALNVTFSRIVLPDNEGGFVCAAAFPRQVLDRDLGSDQPEPREARPYYRRALTADEPLVLAADVSPDAAERQALFLDLAQSLCLVPLRAGGEALGVLVLGEARTRAREPFDSHKLRLIAAMVHQATIALERAREHQEVKAAETRYRGLFDGVPVGLYRTTPAGQVLDANLALVQMLGYPNREALLAANAADVYVNPEVRQQWRALLEREGVVRAFEMQLRRRDGTIICVRDSARAVRDAPGQVRYYEGSLEDITERKQAEAAEREQRTLAEALRDTAAALNSTLNFDELLDRILANVGRVVPHETASIMLIESGVAEIVRCRGFDERGGQAGILGRQFQLDNMAKFLSMVETCTPVVVTDTRSYSDWIDVPETRWIRSHIAAPICVRGQVLGFLNLDSATPGFFTPTHAERLQAFADQAAIAIANARLLAETQRHLQRLAALRRIDTAITGTSDLRVSLTVLLSQVTTKLSVDAAAVLLLNQHSQLLEYAAGRGFRTDAITRSRLRLGESYAGRAALERRTLNILNLADTSDFVRAALLAGEDFVAYYSVPLVAKGQVKGVLEIFHRAPLHPDQEWVDFLESLAVQAAIAIDNAVLFDDLQRSNVELILAYDATIEGWSRALDLRDRETEGHTQRVTEMTLHLAQVMGMREAELVHVRRGALLHDIGKMGIPDSILHKPGPLTEAEWEIMRRHPVYAYEMLAPITYLRPALDIPYCHHEQWDGSGYPRGLKGAQIPLAARIFAVADVWDALTSDRPYRAAWPEEQALDYIRDQAGAHFDPQVVEVFLNYSSW